MWRFRSSISSMGLLMMLSLLSSCWSIRQGLPVENISEPQFLKQAKNLTVTEFFHLRMENRPRKALVGLWLIVYEDQSFVYLGYPHFDGLSDQRSTAELYRIRKSDLQQVFPGYEQIDGNQVRLAAQQALQQEFGPSVSLPWGQWEANLEQGVIQVHARVSLEEEPPALYELSLSALDLSVLTIQKEK